MYLWMAAVCVFQILQTFYLVRKKIWVSLRKQQVDTGFKVLYEFSHDTLAKSVVQWRLNYCHSLHPNDHECIGVGCPVHRDNACFVAGYAGAVVLAALPEAVFVFAVNNPKTTFYGILGNPALLAIIRACLSSIVLPQIMFRVCRWK